MMETAFAQDRTRCWIIVPCARLECVPPIVRKRMGNRISDGLRANTCTMHVTREHIADLGIGDTNRADKLPVAADTPDKTVTLIGFAPAAREERFWWPWPTSQLAHH